LQLEIDRAARYDHPFTLAYLDIDDFKSVNDRFGHSVGDRVLRLIADSLKRSRRKTDLIARAGGDEFVVLLPETGADTAKIVVSKAIKCIIDEAENTRWLITISVGVVTFVHAPPSADSALDIADKVMYEVKSHGKNNVIYSIRAI
jgi:diguanylate cyclase (GGDEF)-like protein